MRALFWLTLLGLTVTSAAADEQLIERFDGHNSLTTSDFNVPDHWEIRWHSSEALSVGIIRLDNTVVAGATGMNSGSLYLPRGGTYRIRVKGEDPIPWDITVISLTPGSPAPETADTSLYYVPTPGPDDATNSAPEEAVVTPPPATNVAPTEPVAPPPPPPVPARLTPAQEQAVVVVKGDRTQGEGFLLKCASGPVVITNLNLISDNPNLAIVTTAGLEIKMTSLQGAADRDLAKIGIEDNTDPALPAATDIGNTVQPEDAGLTSADSSTAPPSVKATQVLAVGSQRINFSNFQNHAVSGGPILQAKSGGVIAVVSEAPRVAIVTNLDKVSFATRDAAVSNSMSIFGLRLDTVSNWETYDWKRFSIETEFLDQFHQRSRCLDSYLDGRNNDPRPAARLYLTDDKVKAANDTFLQDSAGGDESQRMQSLRALLFELGTVADIDLDQIQQPTNFYSFDERRAQEEIVYRQALKAQLDYYSDNLNRFSAVVRRNN